MRCSLLRSIIVLLIAVFFAGCAQPEHVADFPREMPELCDGVNGKVETFFGQDGKELGYVAYRQNRGSAQTALIYLHGIESHAGWFDCASRLLRDKGYDIFCFDRRGSGINRENRGFISGHINKYDIIISDIYTLRRSLPQQYQNIFLVGLSWGGKLAYTYNLIHPGDFDGLILITPGLVSHVDVTLFTKIRILFSSWFKPTAGFELPIATEMFTTTPRYFEWINNDPLRNHQATAKFLMESNRMDSFIRKNAHRSNVPIQLFLAGNDKIIDNSAVESLLNSSKTSTLTVITYENQTHSIQFDAPGLLTADMHGWIAQRISKQERKEK